MKILIAGGTGFVGTALTAALLEKSHEITILTRSSNKTSANPRVRFVSWDLFRVGGSWEREADGVDAVVNLTGESIVARLWTPEQKKKLLESRIRSVRAIYRAMEHAPKKPRILLNASAIGYYGPRGDEILDENSPRGEGFLADLCRQWEDEVMKAEALKVRTVRLRIGLVLAKEGGVLSKMLPPFQLGLGGPLGDGKQWMSWIHRSDLVRIMITVLEQPDVSGAFNGTALNPVRMNEFSKTLGKVLWRPAFFRVPGGLLKLMLGELSELFLTGQCVLPQRAIQLGFSFQYPTLESALRAILEAKN